MFKSIVLEMGLKPFKKTDKAYIKKVCENVFHQWRPIIKNRECISIMLWAADGSEILDYTGNQEKEFEWCCYVGGANNPLLENLPVETSLHERKQYYTENPPKMTYRILKDIIETLKAEGKRQFPESKIQIGATFDIGPEFAVSEFKYNRHKEIVKGMGCDFKGFVDATELLNGDTYPYAAYPDGIPDKTPMGTFLGAQCNVYLRDMGFDYIWLSNGMGFCYEPWSDKGKVYDGKEFHIERLNSTKEKIFLFWKYFREQCVDFPIHTRGTNYSVGIDYASDGVPLYDIYNSNLNILPPPNSPWAAINDDIGIEVLGHLTRNCELPSNDYLFRYYLHDMWWLNSPWYDRYEGQPHDIYIPMALSRIDENGKTQTASQFNVLSIDNSRGEMPDNCAFEMIPHVLKAEKDEPDEPAPLVLVYPFREYTTSQSAYMLEEMYFCDTYLKDAINSGLPLACVVSTDNFLKHNLDVYSKCILLVPVQTDNADLTQKIADYAQNGGKIILYGNKKALNAAKYICQKVDIYGGTDKIFEALENYNFSVRFKRDNPKIDLPTVMVHRSDNAMMFSVYNRNTTVETRFKMPLGAPILNGFDTRLKDGYSTYTFPKSIHSECRVFVKQSSGIVKAREQISVNCKYRRRIEISGLDKAEVCLFAESYCQTTAQVATFEYDDATPVIQKGWQVIDDKENGIYLYAKKVSGTISLCMPYPDKAK